MFLALMPYWAGGAGLLSFGAFPLVFAVGERWRGVTRLVDLRSSQPGQAGETSGASKRPAMAAARRMPRLADCRRRLAAGSPGPMSGSPAAQAGAREAEAVNAELRFIARDLHDGLQVQLVLLGLQAQQIAREAGSGITAERARSLREGIDRAAAELRLVVHGLMPPGLAERGLCAAAEDLFDRLPLPARLEVSVSDHSLPPNIAHTAYFVMAEAVSNALKHAGAEKLEGSIGIADDHLVVEVRDDGVGGADAAAGSGLAGLAERVRAKGGTLLVDSPPGRGTHLRALLPCALVPC